MTDTNTQVPNADGQAAAILRTLDEAIASGARSAHALSCVMEELCDFSEVFFTLSYGNSSAYAVTTERLGAIAAELRGLAREQSPPPAPTNEQAAPAPILIPLEGLPDGARDRYGCCWFGIRIGMGLKYWRWTFESYTTSRASSLGYTHYLPHNTPPALRLLDS